jgi:GlcNAc-P-P-Und epimerase
MKRIFITGATGFIGKHVLSKLLDAGNYELVVLTRLKKETYKKFDNLSYIVGDITDCTLMKSIISDVDYVIHLAGSKNEASAYYSTNVVGTKNIIQACKTSNILKLIHLSSVGVIGKTSDIIINELTPCNPVNEYEKSKLEAELLVKEFSKREPGKVKILRPTNVFGEGDPDLHLLNLIRKISSNRFFFIGSDISKYYLNYLYVKEISELISRLISNTSQSDIYILNTPIPLMEFITVIKELLGDNFHVKSLPYWPIKIVASFFDIMPKSILNPPPINSLKLNELTNKKKYSSELLAQELNWEPVFSLNEALSNLIGYYCQKGLFN